VIAPRIIDKTRRQPNWREDQKDSDSLPIIPDLMRC